MGCFISTPEVWREPDSLLAEGAQADDTPQCTPAEDDKGSLINTAKPLLELNGDGRSRDIRAEVISPSRFSLPSPLPLQSTSGALEEASRSMPSPRRREDSREEEEDDDVVGTSMRHAPPMRQKSMRQQQLQRQLSSGGSSSSAAGGRRLPPRRKTSRYFHELTTTMGMGEAESAEQQYDVVGTHMSYNQVSWCGR